MQQKCWGLKKEEAIGEIKNYPIATSFFHNIFTDFFYWMMRTEQNNLLYSGFLFGILFVQEIGLRLISVYLLLYGWGQRFI